MIVISDTTPIISLLKIGRLDILQQLFSEILIPDAVYHELIKNDIFHEEAVKIQQSVFIKRVTVAEQDSVKGLRRATGLDWGESEAIFCADMYRADLLLIDEVKGRQVAIRMGLPVMGTIGLLIAACKENIMSADEALACINILRQSRRHISEKLYQYAINKIKGKN